MSAGGQRGGGAAGPIGISGVRQAPDEHASAHGGAIASLSGVGLLLIFMVQTLMTSSSTFCSGALLGRSGRCAS